MPIKNLLQNIKSYLKEGYIRGKKWIGYDGLLNMETSALLNVIINIFLNAFWSLGITCFIVGAKCLIDKKNGHSNEKHDLICASIGIIIGFLIIIA